MSAAGVIGAPGRKSFNHSEFSLGLPLVLFPSSPLRVIHSKWFLTAWRHYLPFLALLADCTIEWADLFVFVCWTEWLPNLWPRVFWECAGRDRNLHSGGSKVAFVSLDSSGPVMCLLVFLSSFASSARATTPTIPSLVTCFIAMHLGPSNFISACVCCIMGSVRESCDWHIEREPVSPHRCV